MTFYKNASKTLRDQSLFSPPKTKSVIFLPYLGYCHYSKLNYSPFYDLQNIAYSQSKQMKKGEQEKILDRGSLGAKT